MERADPLTLAAGTVGLFLIGSVASLIPAPRAVKADGERKLAEDTVVAC